MDYFLFLAFVFGAIIGSFLNVLILRAPTEEKLTGRSHCPSCKKQLGALDLVPILSFVVLRGRCRHCGVKISPRYLIIETICAFLFAVTYLLVKPLGATGALLLLKDWLIVATLICVFVIDLEHYIILDNMIFPAAAAVFVLNILIDLSNHANFLSFNGLAITGLIFGLIAPLPFFLVWYFSKGQWMGFGDVKLAIFLGLVLGWPGCLVGIMAAIFLGGIFSLVLLAFTSSTMKTRVPFGTFLAVGSIVALFFGASLFNWYLSILGF